jgi:glycosyltransferase involved in cell wall biosynthesis
LEVLMEPLVSILIPAYNAQNWIADTIRSALAQTWPYIEIIVVDDGSTDYTRAVAQRFESRLVRVVSQRNLGAAAARNLALSLSGGEYIQWLDADDLLERQKIARQMAAMEYCRSTRSLLSSEWGRFWYRTSRAQFVQTALWRDREPAEWLRLKLAMNLHMQTATWLVSRVLTTAAGPWDTRLLGDDDGEYFCRVLRQSDGVRFVPGSRVFYRSVGPSGLSYIARSGTKMDAQFRSMQMHIGYLLELEDSCDTRAACVSYLQNWLPNFHPERPDLVEQAERLAGQLGGHLALPRLSWKYAWIETLSGSPMYAKRAQIRLRELKWSVVRRWDRALCRADDLQPHAR